MFSREELNDILKKLDTITLVLPKNSSKHHWNRLLHELHILCENFREDFTVLVFWYSVSHGCARNIVPYANGIKST